MEKEVAVFGGGCFWHVQKEFDELKGVIKTDVGYMGGSEDKKNYSYKDVCSGSTGHAEVCRVKFDDKKISYKELLEAFWNMHNPTQVDRQGFDIGKQYRSIIFCTTEDQKKLATSSKNAQQKKLGGKFLKRRIATTIESIGKFYKAEDYHQKYLEKKGLNTCPA